MRRVRAIIGMTVLLVVVMATAASAAEFIIPIDTVVRAAPGSITVLAVEETPAELVGFTCVGVATASNQDSVHPNNDLLIESNGTQVVIPDVESEPYLNTPASGSLVLGPTVTVSLRMGPDGVFSGGIDIVLDANCTPPPVGQIEIIKLTNNGTDDGFYDTDMIGYFTIEVRNPGPLDLTDVHVTDDVAVAFDPDTDCVNPAIGDLAVGESYTYACSVANLDGSPFTNTATAIGTDTEQNEVTATDSARVTPVFDVTVTTQPPTTEPPTTEPPTTVAPTSSTTPSETLPVTGVDSERLQGFGLVGISMVVIGLGLLGGAALIGRMREDR